MKNALKNCFFNCKFKNFEIASDNENIIKIGLGEEEGISLILGTGVCLFEVKKNSRIRKSGWGYLIDEGGSAYNFGIDAMKTYFSYVDGYIPKTILHSKIEEKAGCMSTKLIENIYSEKKHYVASFAPLVFEAAEKYDDELAKSIIDKNMKLVAQLIDNALLDFDEEKGPVNCVISGGLTKQKKLIKYIQENLKDKTKVNIKVLDIPMVLGAVSMAKELHNKREGKSYV